MTLGAKGIKVVVVSLVLATGFALGQTQRSKSTEAKSSIVGVYVESVARQINIKDLQKRYPGNTAQRIDPAALRADAIVGWYDKGNNYHEQKMQNNLAKTVGGERIFPELLKGTALRGAGQR
jgi:hypothetical protein